MAQVYKTVREQALDHLCVTEGPELDISCNITTGEQIYTILESEAHASLGSTYTVRVTERMLRLTDSYQARHRQDIVEIARARPEGGEQ